MSACGEQFLCYDLYCGLFGWGTAFAQQGFRVVGFDLEDMSANLGLPRPEGCELIMRDVRSIHGSELKDATCIVGSSPCQEFSYRAMPWSRAKALPPPYLAIELFNAQFRIQREASEAAGRHIPMVVENVRGAQKWVGQAAWHYGSFYLWGDVPALMPMTLLASKLPKGNGSSPLWKDRPIPGYGHQEQHLVAIQSHVDDRDGVKVPGIPKHPREDFGWNHSEELQAMRREGVKHDGSGWTEKGSLVSSNRLVANTGVKNGKDWFGSGENCSLQRKASSRSNSRKAASAMIAKIPQPLAQHIARTFKCNCEFSNMSQNTPH